MKNIHITYQNYSKKYFYFKYCSLCAFFALFFLCLSPNKAFSQDYFILTHSNYSDNENSLAFELFFSLNDMEALEREVRNGASVNINFSATLYEASFFFDSKLYEYTTGWQIRYEALSNEYILYFEDMPPNRSHDLEYLLSTILKRRAFAFVNISPLDVEEEYYLEIHINLQQATTPPWLESTLFFWTWDVANLNYNIDLKLK